MKKLKTEHQVELDAAKILMASIMRKKEDLEQLLKEKEEK